MCRVPAGALEMLSYYCLKVTHDTSFSQVDTVPKGPNEVPVTCFVQNMTRIRQQSFLPTLP